MSGKESELDRVINGLRQLPQEKLGVNENGAITGLLEGESVSFLVKMSGDGGLYDASLAITDADGKTTFLDADQGATEKLWKLQRKAEKNGQKISKLDLTWEAKKQDEISHDPRVLALRTELAQVEGDLAKEIEAERGRFMYVADDREL
jgi:hypothetical protein